MLVLVSSKQEWEGYVSEFDDAGIAQYWDYGELQASRGGIVRAVVKNNGNPSSLFQGKLIKNMGITRFLQLGEVSSQGILYSGEQSLREALKDVSAYCRENSVMSTRIYDFNADVVKPYEENGFARKQEWTLSVDLSVTEEQLASSLSSSCRRNVKKAQKAGVEILKGKNYVSDYHGLVMSTVKRKPDSEGHSLEYFEKVFSVLGANAELYMAKLGGDFCAGAITVSFGGTVYHYDAAIDAGKEKGSKASNLLHYEILLDGIRKGFKRFEFWGVNPDPNSSAYGVYLFKKSFGGREIPLNMWEKNNSALSSIAENVLKPVVKKIIR